MGTKPTHEQAQLHLQLYEMRREVKLRQARDWYFKNYFVNSMEDFMRIAGPGTEGGPLAMMVMTYWEQACALLNYGLLHEDLFFETTGEFFGVWERVRPTISIARQSMANQNFLGHLEKTARRFEEWNESRNPGHIAAMRKMMAQAPNQATAAAKG